LHTYVFGKSFGKTPEKELRPFLVTEEVGAGTAAEVTGGYCLRVSDLFLFL
jgi:hypothetical protein